MPSQKEREQQRISEILKRLEERFPDAECALTHRSAFELLMATILSAQCTDERVNMVTPVLFARYPGPGELAQADMEELQEIIRSTGFFRNKAKSLRGAAEKIAHHFDGEVPQTMDDLLTLPGVARKTANVVLGTWYGIADGVVVDTHVRRLSQRLGLTRQKEPQKIERDLMKKIPQDEWIALSHRLIHHGRQTCKSQKPRCEECSLAELCPHAQR
ncbi:MAG: endonuclease III [Acidobacteriota bacterium]|nr:MAG: endonuclease III [Acidobacteriota bacterium]